MNNVSSSRRRQILLWAVIAIAAAAAIYLFLPSIYESQVEAGTHPVYQSHANANGDTSAEAEAEKQTDITPIALVGLLVAAYLTWTLPRRFAVAPLIVTMCLMPLGQQLVLFGLHFHLFRILLLLGVARIIAKGEAAEFKWTFADKLFVLWVIVSVVLGTMSKLTLANFQNRLGDAYNAAFCYFFVRCVITDIEDVVFAVRVLAWTSLPVAALMAVEKMTGHNYLSIFGGVGEIDEVREGQLRAQGAFRHPILAGMFGATQIPLFAALSLYRPRYRLIGLAGLVSALVIAVSAASSGAVMAALAAIGSLGLWKFRRCLRWIRWGAVVALLGLTLVMHAPVWHLMSRISAFAGSTGWHRAYVIDVALSHLNEWWLFGTNYTAHWGPGGQVIANNPDMMDITNHYVVEGVKGGLLRLALFVALIIECFRGLGRVLRDKPAKSPTGLFIWAMGASLFAHCVAFISITYFDQSILVWYWLLAAITCLGAAESVSLATLPALDEADWDQASPASSKHSQEPAAP